MIRDKIHTIVLVAKKEDGSVLGKFTYESEEATCNESLDFYDMIEKGTMKDRLERVRGILGDKEKGKYEGPRKSVRNVIISSGIPELIKKIANTVHKIHKSIYTGIDIDMVMKSKSLRRKAYPPPGVAHRRIASSLGIPADELLDRITLEQRGIYHDSILYESFESSKEGKKVNDMAWNNKLSYEERKKKKESIRKKKMQYIRDKKEGRLKELSKGVM